MDEKSSPISVSSLNVRVFCRPFQVTYERIRAGRQDSVCREGGMGVAGIPAITGGGSDWEQVKPWSDTLLVKADPPSIIFLASHSFKDNLHPKALVQSEDM